MKKIFYALPMAALLAACGSGGSGGGSSATQLQVVGSSTVYPFTTAVAEEFQRANPGISVIVESTGTGAGMKLFCQGVGSNTPDMTNASRRIKASELEACNSNGVNQVIEFPVGIDGMALIQSAQGEQMELSLRDLYAALAARPFGEEQTARTWQDVNPSLPATPIRVLGPPPTSGTRDSLNELFLEAGCASDPRMKALKEQNEDEYKEICTRIREDGAFVEAGENDNLLVQKVATDPNALGVLGYSFLAENRDQVQPVEINGVAPTDETISNLSYPGARKIYVYAKGEHMQAKPAMRDFIAMFARMAQQGGPLQQRGLVPFRGEDAAAQQQQATQPQPLTASELK
jgi:phosphate transport system substrate-binding protein